MMSLGYNESTFGIATSLSKSYSWDLVGHVELCYLVENGITDSERNFLKNMCNFAVSTVPADGLTLWKHKFSLYDLK